MLLHAMKVTADIVYDKHSGYIIGFCNLGTELLQFECNTDIHPVAKQTSVVMIHGLCFKLDYPHAHFSTEGVTADLLFPIVCDGIRTVESTGWKLITVTADGACPNRKFFRMHGWNNVTVHSD